jgi:hypothetical protein
MFGDINLTPTIKEYAQILNFSNEPHKVYFKQRIRDMTTEVTKLLHLDKINQYRTTNRGFKWKLTETKLKVNKDEGNLGEERYQVVAFPSLVWSYFL